MAANTVPIYPHVPGIGWATAITAANTAMDGTGTVTTVFTADATDGSWVYEIRLKAAGTNVATVARIFINNGSTNATASNNALFEEITLAATTASNVAALSTYTIPVNRALPPGYKLHVVLGTAVAAGWIVSVYAGHY